MKLFDQYHRVIAEISLRRLQIGTFCIEGKDGFLMIGSDASMITKQPVREQCSKCSRWVGSACEVADDPERCAARDGPWDGWCMDTEVRW